MNSYPGFVTEKQCGLYRLSPVELSSDSGLGLWDTKSKSQSLGEARELPGSRKASQHPYAAALLAQSYLDFQVRFHLTKNFMPSFFFFFLITELDNLLGLFALKKI